MPSNTTSSGARIFIYFIYHKKIKNIELIKVMKNNKRHKVLKIIKGHESNLKNPAIQTLKEAFGSGS